MANVRYPKFDEALIRGDANTALSGNLKISLIDTTRTVYNSAHTFFSDLNASGVMQTATLSSKTYTGGVLDADDAIFSKVVGDYYWGNTVLYLPMNGDNNSTVFTDYKGHAVTPYGGAKISTANSKFGGSSACFDGDGDYLSIPYSPDWNLETVDFTIECWCYLTSLSLGDKRIMSTGGGIQDWNSTTGIHLLLQVKTDGRVGFEYWNGSTVAGVGASAPIQINSWNHIAVSKTASNFYIGINGVIESFILGSIASPSANPILNIGTIPGEYGRSDTAFPGYIQDFRITKGVARYTSDYTPPPQILTRQEYQCGALLIWIDTGTASTSRLIAWIDTGVSDFPLAPNGTDIVRVFDSMGIMRI